MQIILTLMLMSVTCASQTGFPEYSIQSLMRSKPLSPRAEKIATALGDFKWLENYWTEYLNGGSAIPNLMERMQAVLLIAAIDSSVGTCIVRELLRARWTLPSVMKVARSDSEFGIGNRYERIHDFWLIGMILTQPGLEMKNSLKAVEYIMCKDRGTAWGKDYSWMRVFNSDPNHLHTEELDRDIALMKQLEIMGHLSGDFGLTAVVQAYYNVSHMNAVPSVIQYYRETLSDITEIVIGGNFWKDKWVDSGTDLETINILRKFRAIRQ